MLKLIKNQAKAEHHPEAVFLLFENCSLFLTISSAKANLRYFKNVQKTRVFASMRLYD